MNQLPLLVIVGLVASILALGAVLPVSAASTPAEPVPVVRAFRADEKGTADAEQDVSKTVLWTVFGVAAGGLAFTTLYLLKRRVGGFPKDPSWIAPITIMPSHTFADESTFSGPGNAQDHSPGHH